MLVKIIVLSMILERIWENLQQLLDDPLSKRVKIIGSALLARAGSNQRTWTPMKRNRSS